MFTLIKQAKPDMRLDLRAKDLPDAVIEDALKQGLAARVSTKFWMEQMGLPAPPHTRQRRRTSTTGGTATPICSEYPQRYRVHWQLWSGGTTRLLLWGDPEYVRRFAGAARSTGGTASHINEMLATQVLGEPHGSEPLRTVLTATTGLRLGFDGPGGCSQLSAAAAHYSFSVLLSMVAEALAAFWLSATATPSWPPTRPLVGEYVSPDIFLSILLPRLVDVAFRVLPAPSEGQALHQVRLSPESDREVFRP